MEKVELVWEDCWDANVLIRTSPYGAVRADWECKLPTGEKIYAVKTLTQYGWGYITTYRFSQSLGLWAPLTGHENRPGHFVDGYRLEN